MLYPYDGMVCRPHSFVSVKMAMSISSHCNLSHASSSLFPRPSTIFQVLIVIPENFGSVHVGPVPCSTGGPIVQSFNDICFRSSLMTALMTRRFRDIHYTTLSRI